MGESPEAVKLTQFFSQPVCQQGTRPLREGAEVKIEFDNGVCVALVKRTGRMAIETRKPTQPDMTFHVPVAALSSLAQGQFEDVGDVGLEIVKLMIHEDEKKRIRAEVHIGLFEMLRKGYLGVIPLGGKKLMSFLASKGFSSMGKIKDGISRMRQK